MSVAASLPSVRNGGYRTSRKSAMFWRCQRRQKTRGVEREVEFLMVDLEPAHKTIKLLCPDESVSVSISPACWKQRIRRIVWKMMFACREWKRTMIAVGCISDVKEWTGVHSSLVVPLHNKILTCWVNKLQLGNWQNREVHNNAYTSHDDHYEIYLGMTTKYTDRHPACICA